MRVSEQINPLHSDTLEGTVLSLEGRMLTRHVIRSGFSDAWYSLVDRFGKGSLGNSKAQRIVDEAVVKGYLERKAGLMILTLKGRNLPQI